MEQIGVEWDCCKMQLGTVEQERIVVGRVVVVEQERTVVGRVVEQERCKE